MRGENFPGIVAKLARTYLKAARTGAVVALVLIFMISLNGFSNRSLIRPVQAASPPTIEWSEHYGAFSTDEEARSVIQTSDGGYALAGTVYSWPNPPTGYHGFLVKTDSSGTMEWNKTYVPGAGEDRIRSVVKTSDGYVMAGHTSSYPGGVRIWLFKIDLTGIYQWGWVWNKAGDQNYGYSLIQTSDGGFAVAGKGITDTGESYACLLKTNSVGNITVPMGVYGAEGLSNVAYSVAQTRDGGYILAGSAILKVDSNLVLEWSQPVQYPGDPATFYDAQSIIQTSDGGYAYTGAKSSLQEGNDIYLTKTDSNGNPLWTGTYGGEHDDNSYSVVETGDGYALVGGTKSYGHGDWDFYVVKTDIDGVQEWHDFYGGALADQAYCGIRTSDGGLALAGYSDSYTNGGGDMWLVKLAQLPYSATIWAWDALDPHGWIAEPITMDGVPTGFSTPHTFTGLTETHTFTVPDIDVDGRSFTSWNTGETSTTLTVTSGGTHTAEYGSYLATIWAWDPNGWLAEPITMDGVPTYFTTPHTFTGLSGTHTFTVPDVDVNGLPFSQWDTGEPSTTLTVTSGGIHTAQYGLPTVNVQTWYWTDDTFANSVIVGNVDGDLGTEIVTGGHYFDITRDVAQLCVWNGETLALENVRTWYWTGDTVITSVSFGNVDGDGSMEIVTGGYYNDGIRYVAQVCVWDGATLALENVKVWHWTGETLVLSVMVANVDGDNAVEIVTGGYYNDGTRDVAQLCVWNGATLALENVRTWYWTSGTCIRSIAIGNIDGDGALEIVTGGYFHDFTRYNAQLCVWDASTLALENVEVWYWSGDTLISSVAVSDVDADGNVEVVTGGYYFDGLCFVAQLCVWNGATLALENITVWYWTNDTQIWSLAVGDVDGDAAVEIITGCSYWDGHYVAQLCVWDGATLTSEKVIVWSWGGGTNIDSVAVGCVDADSNAEIVTSGRYYSAPRTVAQLCVWS